MKKKVFIYGPAGSKKTTKARQMFSTIANGDTVELNLCLDQPQTIKDIGCLDSTKLLIVRNVPDEAALNKIYEIVLPLLEDESGIECIVFTSSRVKPFSLPDVFSQNIEIISTELKENVLIHYDQALNQAQENSLNTLAKYMNESVRIFKSFDLSFKHEELQDLIFNAMAFVKNKQVEGEEVTVSGLKLNKTKLMELVELPDNFHKLEKIVTLAQTQIQNIMLSQRLAEPKDVFKLFEWAEGDNLQIKERIFQKLRENNEVYIRSIEAKKAYFFAVEFLALLKKYDVKPNRLEPLIMAYIKVDNKGEYVINWAGIKNREVNALGFPSFSKN